MPQVGMCVCMCVCLCTNLQPVCVPVAQDWICGVLLLSSEGLAWWPRFSPNRSPHWNTVTAISMTQWLHTVCNTLTMGSARMAPTFSLYVRWQTRHEIRSNGKSIKKTQKLCSWQFLVFSMCPFIFFQSVWEHQNQLIMPLKVWKNWILRKLLTFHDISDSYYNDNISQTILLSKKYSTVVVHLSNLAHSNTAIQNN